MFVGLRKTGKTSLLFKVKRFCENNSISSVIYLDCKRPDIRAMRWDGLIKFIADEISKKIGAKLKRSDSPISDLMFVLSKLGEGRRLCIMFDEIEYISPISTTDEHWVSDFVPFWQTLWSIQSDHRLVSYIISRSESLSVRG